MRELKGLLWAAINSSAGRSISLTREVQQRLRLRERSPSLKTADPSRRDPKSLTAAEIQAALERHDWNVANAWSDLGLSSRYVLYRLMRKYGIQAPDREM